MRAFATISATLLATASTCTSTFACDAMPQRSSSDLVGDQLSVAQEATIPAEVLAKIRAKAVAIAHAPGQDPLVKGIEELAASDPGRHALPTMYIPDASWYRDHAGVGHYAVYSGSKPDVRIAAFAKHLVRDMAAGGPSAAFMAIDRNDIPDGRTVEMVYTTRRATMDINIASASLTGSFTETLNAPRVLATGNGAFLLGNFQYPIELPNVAVTQLSTTSVVPAGSGGDDTIVASLSPRDPRMAFDTYRATMASLEKAHPGVAFVYGTVALAKSGNLQRNWYNTAVRTLCASEKKPLFDTAALLSHDAAGNLEVDDQGEKLAGEWIDTKNGGVTAAARERLAKAWWVLEARMQGWKPAADAPAATDPVAPTHSAVDQP